MLVTSIFSFFHDVFESLLFQGRDNKGLPDKGLAISQSSPGFYVSAVQVS